MSYHVAHCALTVALGRGDDSKGADGVAGLGLDQVGVLPLCKMGDDNDWTGSMVTCCMYCRRKWL